MLKQGVNKTTLAIVVPEVEEIIGACRLKYAPSAALGIPAHITVLAAVR